MVDISIANGRVHLEVEGLDKLWALRSSLEFPVDHIRSARVDREAARGWWHGFRLPGTNLPGIITAGNFYMPGDGLVFFDVHDPERTVVLELHHEHYKRLVIEVADPASDVEKLVAAGVARG